MKGLRRRSPRITAAGIKK